MDISVIIVSYNVKNFLEHCLLSVEKACREITAEIFVVDNNSSDGSIDHLEPKFPNIHFFRNKENVGFAKANNSVLSRTKGDHILFLNPDTILPEDCLKKCIEFFHSTKDCGALGVRMVDGTGNFLRESKRSLPRIFSAFCKTAGLANMFPRSKTFAAYYAGHLPERETNRTEVLAGAFMMLSRKAMEITKGFDEDFFMYGEDVDLSYRILKGGLNNYYFADTTIIHFKGESTGRETKQYRENFYGAMRLFAEKHYSSSFRRFFIKTGIKATKALGSLQANEKTEQLSSLKQIDATVLGTAADVEKIKELLKGKTVERLQQAATLDTAAVLSEQFNVIIFCEEFYGNNKIINDLENLPKETTAMFYSEKANSIIGSNDKNSKGFFIAGT